MTGLQGLSRHADMLENVRAQIITTNSEDWGVIAPALVEWASSFAALCGAQEATPEMSVYLRAIRFIAEVIYVMGYKRGKSQR